MGDATDDETDTTRGFSVVVPVFNSGPTLPELTDRLAAVLATRGQFEIILVNDASRDDSWSIIEKLARDNRFVRGLSLSRNYGQHNALLAGIRASRYDVVVTIDDDLQNPPEEIPRLLERLDGADVVYGTPASGHYGLWRGLATTITKMALRGAIGSETARKVSAFRVFRTGLRAAFSTYDGPFVSIDVLLTWGTARFDAVTVEHDARKFGASNYTMRKLMTHAVNMATGFSTLPLQLASYMGFVFAAFGMVVLAFVVARTAVSHGSVPGFPFLASSIAIFAGAQLFALGIIGEYIARMHFRLMQKPTYLVRERVGDTTDPDR
jgi:glycosyltransferase involved in cell wall biosynthesis